MRRRRQIVHSLRNKIPKGRQALILAAVVCIAGIAYHSISTKSLPFAHLPRSKTTRAVPCRNTKAISVHSIDPTLFTAESGEDKKLFETYLPNLCHGTYLELGALDGRKKSNTFVFQSALDYTGILIELVPKHYKNLVRNRRKDITLHAAVCNERQTVHYVQRAEVSGIWEFAPESFRNKWWPDVIDLNQTIPIQCEPLRDILQRYSHIMTYFDIFSIDVEGAELQVLQSIDYEKVAFGVILVEADEHNSTKNLAVRSLLQNNGYMYVEQIGRSDWFVNERFNETYGKTL